MWPRSLYRSVAWKALPPGPRAVYLELEQRFNGRNNGEIGFGVREMAACVRAHKDTVCKWFRELQRKGFIRVSCGSTFDTAKGHEATTWVLTRQNLGPGKIATWDFKKWRSEKDDFPVFDGAASHQKQRRREEKQSEQAGPSVRTLRTVSPERSDAIGPPVREEGTTRPLKGGADGPTASDTCSLPGGGAKDGAAPLAEERPGYDDRSEEVEESAGVENGARPLESGLG